MPEKKSVIWVCLAKVSPLPPPPPPRIYLETVPFETGNSKELLKALELLVILYFRF